MNGVVYSVTYSAPISNTHTHTQRPSLRIMRAEGSCGVWCDEGTCYFIHRDSRLQTTLCLDCCHTAAEPQTLSWEREPFQVKKFNLYVNLLLLCSDGSKGYRQSHNVNISVGPPLLSRIKYLNNDFVKTKVIKVNKNSTKNYFLN